MDSTQIAIVMPAYNEEAGLEEFLTEIAAGAPAWRYVFVVVDDASEDGTARVAREWAERSGHAATVLVNEHNLGHGPSTLRALDAGLRSGADVVVSVDGDGQFHGEDVAGAVNLLLEQGWDIVEGVRVGRGDPLFRRMASAATCRLVQARCGVRPADANTPLRVYRREALLSVRRVVLDDAMTPNLTVSAESRRMGMRILESSVASRVRRGGDELGATWGARSRSLPSRRFVRFCALAFAQWTSRHSSEARQRGSARERDLAVYVSEGPRHGLQTTAATEA